MSEKASISALLEAAEREAKECDTWISNIDPHCPDETVHLHKAVEHLIAAVRAIYAHVQWIDNQMPTRGIR